MHDEHGTMHDEHAAQPTEPDHTAVRVALWRALHVRADAPPHVLTDELGLRIAGVDGDGDRDGDGDGDVDGDGVDRRGWRRRPDMDVVATARSRASIVARARFIEDLAVARARDDGVGQYVVLGAGLDTFAQRRPPEAARLRIYEVDQPGTQAWKRRRLTELGLGVPDFLRLVPVDFEAGPHWWDGLVAAGFDPDEPAVVASTGVSMYLTRDAIRATLHQITRLAPGSTLAMTFMRPLQLIDEDERPGRRAVEAAARASGTPFISFFAPEGILALAGEAGLKDARHVSAAELTDRYFADRTDGLRPSSAEELLVATV
ncbi:class I SAM-dependent methyltransferase [Streptomyces sp. NPDC059009]|uniref:class I SAM-dependent methyltransferase n=1 Tax=Streptomyces sp. NPDC059009 TaxID=3346694 RepID=UPI0036BC912A